MTEATEHACTHQLLSGYRTTFTSLNHFTCHTPSFYSGESIFSPPPLNFSLKICVYRHTYIHESHVYHTYTQWETQKGRKRTDETGWFTLRFTGCKPGTREGEKASTAQIHIEVHVLYDSYHDSLN